MRLIDADKLVEEMKNTPPNAYTVGQMIYLAENAPTIYDVDKVTEQIENQKSGLTTWAEDEAYKLGLEKSIEIVKSGGVNGN